MFNYFLLFINFQHRSFQNIYFVLYTLLQNSEHSQLKDIFHLTLVMPGIYQYFLFIYFSFLLRSVTAPLCPPPPLEGWFKDYGNIKWFCTSVTKQKNKISSAKIFAVHLPEVQPNALHSKRT